MMYNLPLSDSLAVRAVPDPNFNNKNEEKIKNKVLQKSKNLSQEEVALLHKRYRRLVQKKNNELCL